MQRRANVDDLDDLVVLIRDFYSVDHHPYDEARVLRALRPLLSDDSVGQVWVAEGPERLLGYAIVTWSYSLESGGRDCILDEIYVTQPSEGLGSRLLAAAVSGAQAQGALAIFLETESLNHRAREFYRRNGFETEDSVWMSRPLGSVSPS